MWGVKAMKGDEEFEVLMEEIDEELNVLMEELQEDDELLSYEMGFWKGAERRRQAI